jgi:nucleotide-binding universal stress UspA family protein
MPDIKLIIAGVDGSESSQAAVEWAYDEAVHHDASLTLVMTWQRPVMPTTPPYGGIPTEGYETQPKSDAIGMLDELVARFNAKTPDVEVRTSIEEGSPAKVLIERSKGADLLVVGSRGHGGFAGMLLGSVSQHLVAHAHCPVIVVR